MKTPCWRRARKGRMGAGGGTRWKCEVASCRLWRLWVNLGRQDRGSSYLATGHHRYQRRTAALSAVQTIGHPLSPAAAGLQPSPFGPRSAYATGRQRPKFCYRRSCSPTAVPRRSRLLQDSCWFPDRMDLESLGHLIEVALQVLGLRRVVSQSYSRPSGHCSSAIAFDKAAGRRPTSRSACLDARQVSPPASVRPGERRCAEYAGAKQNRVG